MKTVFKKFTKKLACISIASLVFTVASLTPIANQLPDLLNSTTTALAASERLYDQTESKWATKNYPVGNGYANLHNDGCGIFSFAHAIHALNGSVMDPQEVADFAYENGLWDTNGPITIGTFVDEMVARYGDTYNFKLEGKISWLPITENDLAEHLEKGGVAVAHVYGHYIAVDDYNRSNDTYHVIDSYVLYDEKGRDLDGRDLPEAGWVSASTLLSGTTEIDRTIMLSRQWDLIFDELSLPLLLDCGSDFNLGGFIKSVSNIVEFKIEIVQGSNVIQSYSYNPNCESVDIKYSPVNTGIKFRELPAGSYKLKYLARNMNGATKSFYWNFGIDTSKSTIKINPTSYPVTISKGSTFNLTGTVTSDYPITSFVGEIYQDSTLKQKYSIEPRTKTIDIAFSSVNNLLKFESLETGNYTLRYTATDTAASRATSYINFTVTQPASTLSIRDCSYPSSIIKGSSFQVAAFISSNFPIKSVKATIYQGSTVKQTCAIAPGTKSVQLSSSSISSGLKFQLN